MNPAALDEWYDREMHKILDAYIDGHLSRSWKQRSLDKLASTYEKFLAELPEDSDEQHDSLPRLPEAGPSL